MKITLSNKETRLLLTIKGFTPLNYEYHQSNFDINNKLSFLYPNIKSLTSINHDMIRLVQKLKIESSKLSQLILNLNYASNYSKVNLAEVLFQNLYNLLQTVSFDDIVYDTSLMEEKELSIYEELSSLDIEEGLKFISLYSYGSDRRMEGDKILFERYLEENKPLSLFDLIYIVENFFSQSYKDIDLNILQNIFKENPIPIEIDNKKEFICFRSSGDCSNWGLPFIKVSYSYEEIEGKYNLRYIEFTSGDDYTQGFWKENLTKDELNTFVKVINSYLDDCKVTGMKNSTDFKTYFLSHGVEEDDFDFN